MPAPNCLKGCIKDYDEGRGIFQMYDDPILYPFVEVIIPTGVSVLSFQFNVDTVLAQGNKSSRKFEAQVKSFQYGISNGMGVKIEIVDEAGGAFYNFFKNLGIGNKDLFDRNKSVRFRFGYIKQSIDGIVSRGDSGSTPIPTPGLPVYTSRDHVLFIQDIECQANSAGCFKFIINGIDNTLGVKSVTENKTFGKESERIPITLAIKQLYELYGIGVDFIDLDEKGGRKGLKFRKIAGAAIGTLVGAAIGNVIASRTADEDGPIGVWHGGNRSPMDIAWDWLRQVETDDRSPITFFWEDPATSFEPVSKNGADAVSKSGTKGMRIVYRKIDKHPIRPPKKSNIIGTYIINGARCSPVISFQPNFKYNIQQSLLNAARPAGTAESARGIKQDDVSIHPDVARKNWINLINTGFGNMQQSLQPNAILWFVQGAAKSIADAMVINNYGNPPAKAFPIEAELKIQGNPAYEFPHLINSHFVTIVYINPFRPQQIADDVIEWTHAKQPDNFLRNEVCNPIISNMNWIIKGISHDIRDGTYHTTLKLSLPWPGFDIPPYYPVGGPNNIPGVTL